MPKVARFERKELSFNEFIIISMTMRNIRRGAGVNLCPSFFLYRLLFFNGKGGTRRKESESPGCWASAILRADAERSPWKRGERSSSSSSTGDDVIDQSVLSTTASHTHTAPSILGPHWPVFANKFPPPLLSAPFCSICVDAVVDVARLA